VSNAKPGGQDDVHVGSVTLLGPGSTLGVV